MNEEDAVDDLTPTPGFAEMEMCWDLFQMLLKLKGSESYNARLWAIAATDAEKLYAWISYATGTFDEAVAA